MMSVFNVTDLSDNACINIYPIGGDFVAASDSDVVLSFDPETLETKDRVSGRFMTTGNYYDYHFGPYACTHLDARHIVKTLLQNCLLPELVVLEADPQWSGTKTTELDVVVTLLQPNV